MIAYISGKIIDRISGQIIIKTTSGLGYLVSVNPNKRYMVNENIELFTLHIQREDEVRLMGFDSIMEREWVENLLKVNGVGPKAAANIVYTLGWNGIKEAIEQKDTEKLVCVKGLGKKTAQKIILELKGALVDIDSEVAKLDENHEFSVNFATAMTNMGYKRTEVVSMITRLKKADSWNEDDLTATIRKALGGV